MGSCSPSLGRVCLSLGAAAWWGLSLERLPSAPEESCFCSEVLLSVSLALVVCGKWNSKKKFGESLISFLGLRLGFPCGSAGKESSCNAGDLASIPGLGRSPGEGKGYPLQYCWASLVAQLVKTLPAVWETWVWSLAWEDPPEKKKATHSSILAWRILWTS